MIFSGSRYDGSSVVTVMVNGLPRQVIVPSPQSPYTFSYISYQITGTDRIDSIANAFYGDPSKWYVIGDGNPEILDWSNLPVGKIIRIPNVG